MSDNSWVPPSLIATEKVNIHFDTLMAQARAVIGAQSADLWSDSAAHDPGVTLLEALAYNVSDLAYRHLLPLADLLTPPGGKSNDRLFPRGFSAGQMMTTSPVTAEDYRKGILDLYYRHADGRGAGYFYDALVEKQSSDDRYTYYYLPSSREFVFTPAAEDEDALKFYLNGSYKVRAKYGWSVQDLVSDETHFRQVLSDFLNENRNLCESFRQLEVSGKPDRDTATYATVMNISADVLAQDDINKMYLDIFLTVENFLFPAGAREPCLDFSQTEYTGPRPQNGWITAYPAADFPAENVRYASQLKKLTEALPWVDTVSYISFSTSAQVWQMRSEKILYSWWGYAESEKLIDHLLKQVTIRRGQEVLQGERDNILALRRAQQQAFQQQPEPGLPAGRDRRTGYYYPASDVVPPLYDLQERDPERIPRPLHQFLLPFEQQLANGCAQLALLPALFNFCAGAGSSLWGQQWPFSADSVNHDVHRAYQQQVTDADVVAQQSVPRQTALARYLLSYFGMDFGESLRLTSETEFLAAQRAYLASLPQTGYARTSFQIDNVSSLQRRIAVRLGIMGRLYEPTPAAQQGRFRYFASLPFYLIEHPMLMPTEPGGDLIGAQPVVSASVAGGTDTQPATLVLTSAQVLTGKLHVGQLVDLVFNDTQDEILAIPVAGVGGDSFTLTIEEHVHLSLRWSQVLEAGNKGNLSWKMSNLWLREMSYALVVSKNQLDDAGNPLPAGQWRITTDSDQPWPPALLTDDTLQLESKVSLRAVHQATVLPAAPRATVLSTDAINGEAVVALEGAVDPAGKYQWHVASGQIQSVDRFSLTLSVVFKRSLITRGPRSAAQRADSEARIKQIIQEEVPAHLRVRVLWLSDEQFSTFADTYARWQSKAMRLGSDTWQLLKMLSVGMLPGLARGIGIMRIATDVERQEYDALSSSEEKKQYIDSRGLLYIPWNVT